MYFSEFLATCTIGWVSFCEGGVGLFYFFGGDGTDRAGLGGGYIPRRWSPLPTPAHPERLSTTGSSAGRARTRAGKYQGRPRKARHTRPDAGHAAPVRTRYQRPPTPGRSGRRRRWMAGNSSIMRIVIALSQAWSSDSNMHNYHINLLVYLVIVICYQVLDLPP